jgi:hypothetical protein
MIREDADELVEVTIAISRATRERVWEIVLERDAELCPVIQIERPMTVQDFLAELIEQRLR